MNNPEPVPVARPHPSRRHTARVLAIQALYAWQISDNALAQVIEDIIIDREDTYPLDFTYYKILVTEVAHHLKEIDNAFRSYLDRELEKMTPIELAILRLGVYELLYQLDVPYRIVINESIELAKKFGAQSSHKYINGVMDKVARALRKHE